MTVQKCLRSLVAHKKDDSPAFEQVVSLLTLVENQKKLYEEYDFLESLKSMLQHEQHFLRDADFAGEHREGVPRDAGERARDAWVEYCKYIRLFSELSQPGQGPPITE